MSHLHQPSAINTYELLRTKLVPPRAQATLVPRATLLARLTESAEHKLILISAPAGFGKTTLVSQWVHGLSLSHTAVGTDNTHPAHRPQVTWLSLDSNDNDPLRFWRYAITACQQIAPALGASALTLLNTASRPSWEHVLTRLLNDLAERDGKTEHAVLVLEDYHFITAAQVHTTLTFFLEHLPATFHLLITTRHDPPLPLTQMRARNELGELRAVDMRFSLRETQSFFQQSLPLPLAPAAISYLAERTEGWVAGLRLAALALQKRPQPEAMGQFLATFRGSHEHILTYLVAEVLRAQPPTRQAFLLQTCMLGRLSSALCDAVTGRNDSERMLEQLEQANLFLLPLADDQEGKGGLGQAVAATGTTIWYRYHALFAEAMQQAARRQLSEEQLRILSHKASLWYEQHGLLTEAIETALTAYDFSRTADLIEHTIDPLNPNNEYHTLRRWIVSLPETILQSHPALAFLYAVAILFTSERRASGTFALLQTPLQIAEMHWGEEKDASKLGALLAFRSLLAWFQGALENAFATAKQALERLPEEEMQWRGICLIFVGVEQLQTGQVNHAEKTLTMARALCDLTGNEFGALDAAILLGEVTLRQANLRQSVQLYQYVLNSAASTQMERDQATIREGSALIGLGTLAYEWNELQTSEQQASQALAIGTQVGYVDLQVCASMLLARLDHVRGETDAAQQRLHALIAQTAQPRWLTLVRRVRAEQAWISASAGDLAAVEQWATTVPHQKAEIAELQQVQETFLLARLWIEQGDTNTALNLLDQKQNDARGQGRMGNIIEILILKSLAHSTANDLPQANATLLDALHLAQPSGYIRLFVDEGEWLAHLLTNLVPNITEEPLHSYIQTLLAAFGKEEAEAQSSKRAIAQRPNASTPPLIEPLSERELDVIRLVAAGRATDEVAQELVISVGTVRTHLKHIYAKLDARSRIQAVERARAFHLL